MAAPGEFALIARLTKDLASRSDTVLGVGDDTAILDIGGDMLLLATVDSQVEGVHFTLGVCSPEQVGRRALAVNLSDIAAMGGEARYALVSLILPPHLSPALLEAIYAGLRAQAREFGIEIVGGNIAGSGQGKQLIIDITLLGVVERGHAILRAGARIGDVLCVTGTPGDSAAGLYAQLHPDYPYPPGALAAVRLRQCLPQPRVREGRVLSRLGTGIVTAMLDVSDGLSGDLSHLCERSAVGARIDAARLPISGAAREIAASAGVDSLQWALHGGEDYELLFTVHSGYEIVVARAIEAATGTPVTVIGNITPRQDGLQLITLDGKVEPLQPRSWDHLASQ